MNFVVGTLLSFLFGFYVGIIIYFRIIFGNYNILIDQILLLCRMDEIIRRATIIIAVEELRRSLQPIQQFDPLISSTRSKRRERGESGAEYIHRLLNDNPNKCREQLRLDRDMFVNLVNLMIARNLLVDGKFIKVDEQLGICLYIMAKGASYRDVADRFKHSVSTISYYFRKVLNALVILSHDIIRPHHDLREVSPEVEENSLYWPYFKVINIPSISIIRIYLNH